MSGQGIDIAKANRETTRWIILQTTHVSGVYGVSETTLSTVLTNVKLYQGLDRLRSELNYLELRGLIEIEGKDTQPQWAVKLTRYGYDMVEYAIDCEPGIARPPKYFQGP